MNKLLRVPIDIRVGVASAVGVSEQFVLDVFVHKESLQDLCLGLCLLNEGLIELLIVSDVRGKNAFKLLHKTEHKEDQRARISSQSNATIVELAETGIKYLLHFLLRYYRDGVADVDHVDIEAIDADSGGLSAYLTVTVEDSLPPVSPEEAEKRLTRGRVAHQ